MNQEKTGATATEDMGFEVGNDTYLTGVNPRKLRRFLNQRDPTLLTGYESPGGEKPATTPAVAAAPRSLKLDPTMQLSVVRDPLKTAKPKSAKPKTSKPKPAKSELQLHQTQELQGRAVAVTPASLKPESPLQLFAVDSLKPGKSKSTISERQESPRETSIELPSLKLDPTIESPGHCLNLEPAKPKSAVSQPPQPLLRNKQKEPSNAKHSLKLTLDPTLQLPGNDPSKSSKTKSATSEISTESQASTVQKEPSITTHPIKLKLDPTMQLSSHVDPSKTGKTKSAVSELESQRTQEAATVVQKEASAVQCLLKLDPTSKISVNETAEPKSSAVSQLSEKGEPLSKISKESTTKCSSPTSCASKTSCSSKTTCSSMSTTCEK
uniref:Uncharacterized protein n=1 Tax=Panagrolaimus sp. ES5 TaxID=591445 RepID=A0AC34GCV4_9BILA